MQYVFCSTHYTYADLSWIHGRLMVSLSRSPEKEKHFWEDDDLVVSSKEKYYLISDFATVCALSVVAVVADDVERLSLCVVPNRVCKVYVPIILWSILLE